MRFQSLLLTSFGFSAIQHSLATPIAFPQGTGSGADSCATEPLNSTTWKNLDIDTFLKDAVKNVSATTTNNVQAFADSFGAPNFFCGLDNFCNAGQPCLPVELPAWYAMVAIQNWNSYMNSLNTAISFASSIAGLTLPGVVADFYPKPKDDVTPLLTMSKVFTSVLGVIPFTGPVATANSVLTGSISFITGRIKPPTEANLFLKWSEVSTSLAAVLSDYQAAVSTSIKATLDAKIDDSTSGINAVLAGGEFLGVAENFTQPDLQSKVTDSINIYAISLVLQAQKIFIYRFPNGCTNEDNTAARLCVPGGDAEGGDAGYLMLKADGDANAEPQDDAAGLLVSKYGLTKEQVLVAPTGCYDKNGKKQLPDVFADALPLDKSTECLFNLLVCSQGDPGWKDNTGIVDNCRNTGLDV